KAAGRERRLQHGHDHSAVGTRDKEIGTPRTTRRERSRSDDDVRYAAKHVRHRILEDDSLLDDRRLACDAVKAIQLADELSPRRVWARCPLGQVASAPE